MKPELKDRLCRISLIGFDVDGVFTDGRFYLADDGTETKAFNTQDGFGIRRLLDSGVSVAVISGRKSRAVELRMQELGVTHLRLGCSDKVAEFAAVARELGVDTAESAYVGDDVPDLALLRAVGTAIGVANAHEDIRGACHWITERPGGSGAVREVCDTIVAAKAGLE